LTKARGNLLKNKGRSQVPDPKGGSKGG